MNRRSALKSMLAGLICSLTPMALRAKPNTERYTVCGPPNYLGEMLEVCDGSARDSYWFYSVTDHLPLWSRDPNFHIPGLPDVGHYEFIDGDVVRVKTRSGMSPIIWDGETVMTPHQDYENWILCDGRWCLASREYVPDHFHNHPSVWPNRPCHEANVKCTWERRDA